jgi:hypothetical protein
MTARILTLLLLLGCVIAIPFSHVVLSAKKNDAPAKVAICHFPGDSEVGHVIEVSENAVPAHVSKHGDCTAFVARPNGACRCLTCEEQCQAADARCRAACDEDDTTCLAACATELQQCLADCNPES